MGEDVGALALIERINSLSEEGRQIVDNALSSKKGERFDVRFPVSLGVITALEIEALAVESVLKISSAKEKVRSSKHVSAPNAPVVIRVFELERENIIFRIAVAQALRMGNNSAAIATTSLLYEFPEIKDILMVGIAGGIPSPIREKNCEDRKLIENHVRLGDIFISNSPILQYDMITRQSYASQNRSIPNSISPRCQKIFQEMRRRIINKAYPWEFYIDKGIKILGSEWKRPLAKFDRPKIYSRNEAGVLADECDIAHPSRQPGRRNAKPLVHFGKIGSANVLLKDPVFRDDLRSNHDVRAVEMEGSGVSDAAWNFGIGYAVIRGVSDYCDPEKSADWQKYASVCAASFCRSVIDDMIDDQILFRKREGRGAAR